MGSAPERILIVDDEAIVRDFLQRTLSDAGYVCETAGDGMEALDRFKGNQFALVLSDLRMPRMDGLALLEALKSRDPDAMVVIVSGVVEVESAIRALRLGAYDYLTKPFRIEDALATVERALERRRLLHENREYQRGLERKVEERTRALRGALAEVEETYRMTLEALAASLDLRDVETMDHSRRVADYTLTLAREMDLEPGELVHLERGAVLHDIGKIGISDSILRKPGPLTEEEWGKMRAHCEMGYAMLRRIPFLEPAAEIVLAHQERYDGKGYPRGLKGEAIPIGARIFAVADALDAMTADRPYRKALGFEEAREEICRWAGSQFDPQVVEAFIRTPQGEWRSLRTGTTPVNRHSEPINLL